MIDEDDNYLRLAALYWLEGLGCFVFAVTLLMLNEYIPSLLFSALCIIACAGGKHFVGKISL